MSTGSFKPVGSTDSERAFCWIMQELAKSHAGESSVAELTLTLRELACEITGRRLHRASSRCLSAGYQAAPR